MFVDVEFRWQGETYKIPANRIMRAIAIVEEVITLHELFTYAQKGSAPLAKLAMAFASVLRFAGAKCTDDEVYAAMFVQTDAGTAMSAAIESLLLMMVPKDVDKSKGEAPASGNVPTPGNSTSKKRIKPSSGLAG